MKPEDHKMIAEEPRIGKFYITIDLDYRINGKESDKVNVMRLRYIVKVLLHKHSTSFNDIKVNDQAFDFGEDDEEEGEKDDIGSGVGLEEEN